MNNSLGRSTFEQDAHTIRPLLMERSRLSVASATGATSISVNTLPRNAGAYSGYVVIDPYTTECEVRRVTARAGKALTVAALTYAHSKYDEVLFVSELPWISAKWFGALGDGTTDDSTAIGNAITQADALYLDVMLQAEKYSLGSTGITLTENTGLIGARKSIATDEGTWLTYSGSSKAITIDGAYSTSAYRRGIRLQDFTVQCTHASSSYGIWCDFATLFNFDRIRVTGAKTAGLYMENSYNGIIRQSRFNNSVIGMHFKVKNDAVDNVFSGQTLIEQCDFWDNTDSGVKLEQPYNTLAQLTFLRCHFQSNAYGAYVAKDHRSLWLGCHFETNTTNGIYTHADVASGPVMIGCFFNHSANVYAVDDNGDYAIYQANEFYTSGSPADGYGIQLTGEGARVVDNVFRSMANSIVMESTAVQPKIGVNYFISEVGNKITDNGADSPDWEGEIILTSPVLDLSGSAVTHFAMCADRDLYLREAKVIYTEASSADAGVVVRAGKSGSATYLFSYTSETSQAQWTIAVPSISNRFIDGGTSEIITFGTAGGKTGGGECVIELYFLPYNLI